MIRRHVDRYLAAYRDGALPEDLRRLVERHLARCRRCRERATEVEAGRRHASALGGVALPEEAEERILAALRRAAGESEEAAAPASPRHAWRWAAAATVALGLAFLAVRAVPDVTVVAAGGPPIPLEALALEAKARFETGAQRPEEVTGSPAEVRDWLEARGLSAALADRRTGRDRDAFELVGASDVSRPGMTAAAVSYRVDGHPVLLVAARQDEVAGAPRWGLLGKRVLYREHRGAKLLTWTNSGKAYTLVSDLPGLGQRACLLCHTDERRRRLVAELRPPA